MKVIAFNGSPRKNWNTATLLNKALEGAASQGAETELIHLYDLSYKGCISCFSCKLKGGKSYGKCAVNDDLKPVFNRIEQADALIFGSPIYFGQVTGEVRSFLERLLFQYLVYDGKGTTLFEKKIKTAFIYTMNVREDYLERIGYAQNFKGMEKLLERFSGSPKHCSPLIHTSSKTTPNTSRRESMPKPRRKGGRKYFRKTAGKPMKWESGFAQTGDIIPR